MSRRPRIVIPDDPEIVVPILGVSERVCFLHGLYGGAECPTCKHNAREREDGGPSHIKRLACPRCEAADVMMVVVCRLIMNEWTGICGKGHPMAVRVGKNVIR